MGQELIKQILNNKNLIFIGGFEHKAHPKIGKKISDVTDINSNILITGNALSIFKKANVVIDFTTPQSTLSNVKFASTTKTALVIGTTGISNAQKGKIKTLSKKIPILMSSNTVSYTHLTLPTILLV